MYSLLFFLLKIKNRKNVFKYFLFNQEKNKKYDYNEYQFYSQKIIHIRFHMTQMCQDNVHLLSILLISVYSAMSDHIT